LIVDGTSYGIYDYYDFGEHLEKKLKNMTKFYIFRRMYSLSLTHCRVSISVEYNNHNNSGNKKYLFTGFYFPQAVKS
jgi:hypothetical protein